MGRRVTIYCDSKVAIDKINDTVKRLGLLKNKARIWFRSSNSSLVSGIVDLINSKQIRLELVKVKGHSGCVGNDLVDTIAKNACNDRYHQSNN